MGCLAQVPFARTIRLEANASQLHGLSSKPSAAKTYPWRHILTGTTDTPTIVNDDPTPIASTTITGLPLGQRSASRSRRRTPAAEHPTLALDNLEDSLKRRKVARRELGAPHREWQPAVSEADERRFVEYDPEKMERGLPGHCETLRALAVFVHEQGMRPREPHGEEPRYDLAWRNKTPYFVAEVKSITAENESPQLRLGPGQVLWYRHRFVQLYGAVVVAVLVPERKPRDEAWLRLCKELDVRIAWPGAFKPALALRSPTFPTT